MNFLRRSAGLILVASLAVAPLLLASSAQLSIPRDTFASAVAASEVQRPSVAAGHELSSLPAAGESDPTGRAGSAQQLVAFRSGGRRSSATSRGATRLFRTGVQTLEPTLGIAPDGYVYVQTDKKAATSADFGLVRTVLRTRTGARFEDVGPTVGGQSTHQYTEDPYLYVDPRTGRVFNNDLIFPCQQTSYSDDGGKSWAESVANCDQADHQTIFAGPVPEGGQAPTGYPNVVYDCAINGGALSGTSSSITSCDKSLDGGRTFVPTGSLPFGPEPAQHLTAGGCDGTTGHGVVDRRGVVYLPRGWCGQPYLATSKDEGASWTRVQVATNGMNSGVNGRKDAPAFYGHEAAAVVDAQGVIYYLWVAYDYKPYLAISRDHGAHWSPPMMVAPPGVVQAALPALGAPPQGTPGHLALAFMGSTDAPDDPYPRTSGRYADVTWHGYVVMTTTAAAADPLFYGASFTEPDDPLVRGVCGPLRCQAEYDIIDVQVAPSGEPWVALVDACRGWACAPLGEAVLGTVVNGPRLGVVAQARSR